jgi:hypothetical protein
LFVQSRVSTSTILFSDPTLHPHDPGHAHWNQCADDSFPAIEKSNRRFFDSFAAATSLRKTSDFYCSGGQRILAANRCELPLRIIDARFSANPEASTFRRL